MKYSLICRVEGFTEDQLSEKINELNKKLSIAARSGNGHLCNQIRMALESYQSKYQQLLKAPKSGGPSFDDKIKIQ